MNIPEKLAALDKLKAEIDLLRPINADQERKVLDKFKLDWNYNSNAMEGNSLSLGETAALLSYGLTAKGKPLKDHLDIEGHNRVLDLLGELIKTKQPITAHLIRSIHQIMLGSDRDVSSVNADGIRTTRTIAAGRYKTESNQLVTHTGEVRRFPSPIDTPPLMDELVSSYDREMRTQTIHRVLFAATFHHRFVSIHPFDDGNGRMARILMNLILMQDGYLPAVLKLSERDQYLSALVQADSGDLEPLAQLIISAAIASAETYLAAANGENVDDLADFDKQIALLTQAALTKVNLPDAKNGTSADQIRVIEIFVAPIFEAMSARLNSIQKLFANRDFQYFAKSVSSGNFVKGSIADIIAIVRHTLNSGDLLSEIHLFHNGKGYIADATKDFLVSVKVTFSQTHFAVTIQTYSSAIKEIFRGSYEQPLTRIDAENVSREMLNVFIGSLTKLTR